MELKEPLFSINDVVLYENKLYRVTGVHALNWTMPGDPYVYQVTSEEQTEGWLDCIYIREGVLKLMTEHDIRVWRVLYGK